LRLSHLRPSSGKTTEKLNPIYQLVAFGHDSKNIIANGTSVPPAARSCVAPKADAASLLASKVHANCQRANKAVRQAAITTAPAVTFPTQSVERRSNSRQLPVGNSKNPGNNLLSRFTHYHRPWMLNGRVRNGNGCGHPGMLTGKSLGSKRGQGSFAGTAQRVLRQAKPVPF
jgi:hypothetical protein